MPKVHISYLNIYKELIKTEEISTTGDHVYIFDDISNHINLNDDLNSIPDGTKEIVIRIPCDV